MATSIDTVSFSAQPFHRFGKKLTSASRWVSHQRPLETSFLKTLKAQFPTVTDVSVRASAGVSFFVAIAMKPRFKGEPRQVILSAQASNIRPKWTVIVEPDIDVHNSAEVEWAMAFPPSRSRT
ncbi:MAG: UbiD family decarboxylase [Hyphomicrobiales bacterium]|nr:UbiD family decarboxylase [Hyphomicrobiales bacterium]